MFFHFSLVFIALELLFLSYLMINFDFDILLQQWYVCDNSFNLYFLLLQKPSKRVITILQIRPSNSIHSWAEKCPQRIVLHFSTTSDFSFFFVSEKERKFWELFSCACAKVKVLETCQSKLLERHAYDSMFGLCLYIFGLPYSVQRHYSKRVNVVWNTNGFSFQFLGNFFN